MDVEIKEEIPEPEEFQDTIILTPTVLNQSKLIDAMNSDSYDTDDSDIEGSSTKKQKIEVVLPVGFLDPLRPEERAVFRPQAVVPKSNQIIVSPTTEESVAVSVVESCKQFWKAGDYEGCSGGDSTSHTGGMDRVRVHPKFLHSNATSHKWALGAFAELLDNALDEVCHGATYVHVDMLKNKKAKTKMLLVEDNGGGMTPDTMRQCMSLGYSAKSKLANTIGQYGNGFKTSTMRLGADVIVFSRCRGNDGRSPTQSIGMLSYTFLRRTGKEDIVVPMIDYEKRGENWNMVVRSSPDDWKRNLETIVPWSPYTSEEDLLQQFDFLKDQGTRIIIYNLWEDDQGALELDFDTDHDIQIRGVNRDEKKIEMAQNYPNCRHFLTYRHSLRSYAGILYLRIPPGFRILLRGKDVDHHNLVDDMMLTQEITYKPLAIADGKTKDQNMVAAVTIGFVKDAKYHIDVQGFNVYHKNRLIKPFWRVWNAAGSNGRGVIGVLEANFVEPAHDKQGFERTIVLSRLEARLVVMQKNYWTANCHTIGYAKRQHLKNSGSLEHDTSPSAKDKSILHSKTNGHDTAITKLKSTKNFHRRFSAEDASEDEMGTVYCEIPGRRTHHMVSPTSGDTRQECVSNGKTDQITGCICVEANGINGDGHLYADPTAEIVANLKEENRVLRERIEKMDGLMVVDLLRDLQHERDRSNTLQNKFQKALQKMQEMDKDQESLINVFSEERDRRDQEEESLRKRLKDASDTIEKLLNKVKLLEIKSVISCKIEH